ncbi:uncharacterized protein [Palaemon carinicauda]|uniref:uncharacterized protein n=1 Tax=Palaemon carinicauda TaxID=392227 RepID=UPI0035B680F3
MSMISSQWNPREHRKEVAFDSGRPRHHDKLHKDVESGERLGDPVVVLRKVSPKAIGIRTDHHRPTHPNRRMTSSLIRGYRLYRHFRIKEALRLGEMYSHCSKGPDNFGKKDNYWKARIPLHSSETSKNNIGGEESFARPQRRNEEGEIQVNIWEEFKYGSSVLNEKISSPITHGGCEWVRPFLANLLPKPIVDSILYILFFSVYFVSCCLYNNYLELGCYLLYDLHLRIHENAEKHDIKVKFIGSPFQGPMYCIIRMLCQHCHHYENNKVVLNIMKKMRQDFVRASSS